MRILILGVSGLIGHTLLQQLRPSFETFGTLRHPKDYYGNISLFSNKKIIDNVDVIDFQKLEITLNKINPDVILNCIGITKRKIPDFSLVNVIEINSLFPHKLANWAEIHSKRIIHFSTDCVFDGTTGNYSEESLTTANDLYGKTKALGEIIYNHTLTLRSSFIGQELFGKTELLEWFLAQKGKQIKGFKNTIYSGVSTLFMTQVVKKIILNYPDLHGLYQLATDSPISKYDLISLAKVVFNINVDIVPDTSQVHMPTLNGTELKKDINLIVPSWETMMAELGSKNKFYQK